MIGRPAFPLRRAVTDVLALVLMRGDVGTALAVVDAAGGSRAAPPTHSQTSKAEASGQPQNSNASKIGPPIAPRGSSRPPARKRERVAAE